MFKFIVEKVTSWFKAAKNYITGLFSSNDEQQADEATEETKEEEKSPADLKAAHEEEVARVEKKISDTAASIATRVSKPQELKRGIEKILEKEDSTVEVRYMIKILTDHYQEVVDAVDEELVDRLLTVIHTGLTKETLAVIKENDALSFLVEDEVKMIIFLEGVRDSLEAKDEK